MKTITQTKKHWLKIGTASFTLIALGLGSSGCKRKSAQDTQLQTTISNRLAADPALQGLNIQDRVKGGVVTLTGTAQNYQQLQAASQDAQMPGVSKIVNQISTVSTPGGQAGNSGNQGNQANQRNQANPQPAMARPTPVPAQTTAAAPAIRWIRVPAGTNLMVRINQPLASNLAHAGETFSGRVERTVTVRGHRIIPSGAAVQGVVVYAHSAGHFRGRSGLRLRLNQITIRGRAYAMQTSVWQKFTYARGKRSAIAIGGGAGLGALVGALAGGGKGAAIGGAIGAGTGTAVQGLTHPPEISLPAETGLQFQLARSIQVEQ